MDDIIKKIIEIEDKAQSVFAEAKDAKDGLDERVEKDSEKLKTNLEARAANKCAQVRKIETEAVEEKINAVKKKSEEQMRAFEDKYEKNREKWVSDIVSRITE